MTTMTKNQFRRTFSFLLYIIITCAFPGCASQKNIPQGQASRTPNWKNLYYFHAGDSTWIVKPVPSAGNLFTGEIYQPDEVKNSRQAHIYADPFSVVKIGQGKISVPMGNIVKVENFKIKPVVIVAAVGVLLLLFMIPTVL
jgi:hypothetical protein